MGRNFTVLVLVCVLPDILDYLGFEVRLHNLLRFVIDGLQTLRFGKAGIGEISNSPKNEQNLIDEFFRVFFDRLFIHIEFVTLINPY